MKDRSIVVLHQFVFVTPIFLAVVALLRVYEYSTVAERIDFTYHVLYGILYDICAALSFSALVCIPVILINYWNSRIAYASLVGICRLYIVGTFGLIQYFIP